MAGLVNNDQGDAMPLLMDPPPEKPPSQASSSSASSSHSEGGGLLAPGGANPSLAPRRGGGVLRGLDSSLLEPAGMPIRIV